ncbi:MAG: hypothetical protein ACD_49C00020G0009 [uncultured bacterium (gcode 4)]|uniref:Uncharacterized protein n=1 Tax=uncultured bacterium (gcode 4) TaxID=1234023 RepID=K2BX16_9BACT|nr:MAG: hypothetical protein ACD_49C00020G0009 [uncultured bacterium (gcode 4)]
MVPKENLETQNNENMAQCNFNNYAFVKLTEHWIKVREKYFQKLGLDAKNHPLEVDLKWFAKIQLWELMKIFWNEMKQASLNLPFDMNFQIEVEPKQNWIKKVITSAQKDFANILDKNK